MKDEAVAIETSFYWPPHPTGPVAGYTAPLVRWVQTTITGLTTDKLFVSIAVTQG